jgi:hypothetical protein
MTSCASQIHLLSTSRPGSQIKIPKALKNLQQIRLLRESTILMAAVEATDHDVSFEENQKIQSKFVCVTPSGRFVTVALDEHYKTYHGKPYSRWTAKVVDYATKESKFVDLIYYPNDLLKTLDLDHQALEDSSSEIAFYFFGWISDMMLDC